MNTKLFLQICFHLYGNTVELLLFKDLDTELSTTVSTWIKQIIMQLKCTTSQWNMQMHLIRLIWLSTDSVHDLMTTIMTWLSLSSERLTTLGPARMNTDQKLHSTHQRPLWCHFNSNYITAIVLLASRHLHFNRCSCTKFVEFHFLILSLFSKTLRLRYLATGALICFNLFFSFLEVAPRVCIGSTHWQQQV